MTEVEALLAKIVSTLEGEGYKVSFIEGKTREFVVSKGAATVCVAIHERDVGLGKLSLRIGCGSGLTIVDCSDLTRIHDCLKRLVQVVEESMQINVK